MVQEGQELTSTPLRSSFKSTPLTKDQLKLVVRIQAGIRGFLGRKMAQKLRVEMYGRS